MHARKAESARSVGRRRAGSMKRPGSGGADRREIALVFVMSTLSGKAAAVAVVRAPCGGGDSGGTVGGSWGSSNNESGLSSPSLRASPSSGVIARR